MSARQPKSMRSLLGGARDLLLTILAVGGAQILIALPVWLILFRAYPQGLSMALTLVGFGSWLFAFAFSIGGRGRPGARMPAPGTSPPQTQSIVDRLQGQTQRSGCGFLLFLSSLIPLGLAFFLRLSADLRAGYTWQDLFPPMP